MANLTTRDIIRALVNDIIKKPETGVSSGRGIGIPSAGAVGGGDDYYHKIGRNRRPYHPGETGTPSHSADAGFSSALKQNSGYIDPEMMDMSMFPEQEPDELDVYFEPEVSPLRTRKLATRSPYVSEERMSIYPTLKEVSQMSEDELLKEGLFDIFSTALNFVPHPLVQVPLAAVAGFDALQKAGSFSDSLGNTSQILNDKIGITLAELGDREFGDDEFSDSIEKICRLPESDKKEIYESLKGAISDLKEVAESLFRARLGKAGRKQAAILQLTPAVAITFLAKLFDDIPLVRRIASYAIGPAYVGLMLRRPAGIPIRKAALVGITTRIGAILNAIESDSGTCRGIEPEEPEIEEPEIEEFEDEEPEKEDPVEDIRDKLLQPYEELIQFADMEVSPEDMFKILMKQKALREVRKFIRETIYGAYPSLRKIEPQGYLQYTPVDTEEEDEKDDLDTNDFAVAYKTDSGVITAHPRALKESDIRMLIIQVLDEAKKKRKSKKVTTDDEIGEASTTSSGGGGPVTPLGTGPKGKNHSRKTYIDQVNKNASFYGGSLVNPQDPALIYTAAEKWAKGIAEKSTSKRKKKKKN